MIFKRIYIIPVLLFLIYSGVENRIKAQEISDRLITIKIENKSFIEALDLLENEYGLNFSYDSKLIPKSKIVYTNVTDASLDRFLKALLNSVDLDYKIIDDHIILYYSEQIVEEPDDKQQVKVLDELEEPEIPKENEFIDESVQKIITVYDTVVYTINDTMLQVVYDTFQISITDTIFFYDTIQVHQPIIKRYPHPNYRLGVIVSGYYPVNPPKDYHFTINDAELTSNQSIYSYRSGWAAGLLFEDYYKNIVVRPSILFKLLYEDIELSYSSQREAINDYISDSYYELSDDTTWIDIYDSEIITTTDTFPKTLVRNQYYYLDIPIEIGYEIPIQSKFTACFSGGIKGSILLTEKNNKPDSIIGDNALTPKTFYYSLMAGVRFGYDINKYINISAQISYHQGLNVQLSATALNISITRSFY